MSSQPSRQHLARGLRLAEVAPHQAGPGDEDPADWRSARTAGLVAHFQLVARQHRPHSTKPRVRSASSVVIVSVRTPGPCGLKVMAGTPRPCRSSPRRPWVKAAGSKRSAKRSSTRGAHVAADAGMAPARRSRSAGTSRGAAPGELVAEGRAVGDRGAVIRDQVEPQHRPAREIARRQVVDRDLRRQRRQQEADQAHVVIERQPGDGAVARDDLEAGRPGDARELAISAGWVICTPCGWRVLPDENWM